MDAKDSFMFLVLLLLSLGLFGSLSLTYCVWNKQTEVTSELQSELHELQKRSEIADIQNEQCSKLQSEVQDLNSKLQSELADVQNELHKLQNELTTEQVNPPRTKVNSSERCDKLMSILTVFLLQKF